MLEEGGGNIFTRIENNTGGGGAYIY